MVPDDELWPRLVVLSAREPSNLVLLTGVSVVICHIEAL